MVEWQGVRRKLPAILCGFFCSYLLCVALLAPFGCSKGPKINPKDSAALEALKQYEPTYVLDKQNRVSEITLEGAGVDDEALDPMKDLTGLRRLSLYGSSITDDGLAKLGQNKKLEGLGLGGTRITDRGIKYLEKMPSLRWVWVSKNNPRLTTKRLDELKKTLPDLTVYQD